MLYHSLVYKAYLDNDYLILSQIEPEMLLPNELELYNNVMFHLKEYGILPKIDEPVDFINEPKHVLVDKIRRRYLVNTLENLKYTYVDEENVKSVIETLLRKVNKHLLTNTSEILTPDNMHQYIKDFVAKERDKSKNYYISWNYNFLNKYLGYIRGGEIFTFVARLKQGKSIYLLNIARHIAQSHPVLFFTMEMSVAHCLRRLLFLHTKNYTFLQHGFNITEDELNKILSDISLNLYIIPHSAVQSLLSIKSYIKMYNPRVVIIDGAYLIPERVNRSEWERMKHIIEEIKRIALETDVAFITSFQLNRQAVKSKEVDVEHIAFSDSIAQSSTSVIAILESQYPHEKVFKILANRDGESHVSARIGFNWKECFFEEIEEEENIYEDIKEQPDELPYTLDEDTPLYTLNGNGHVE